jgi:hypothetical protein
MFHPHYDKECLTGYKFADGSPWRLLQARLLFWFAHVRSRWASSGFPRRCAPRSLTTAIHAIEIAWAPLRGAFPAFEVVWPVNAPGIISVLLAVVALGDRYVREVMLSQSVTDLSRHIAQRPCLTFLRCRGLLGTSFLALIHRYGMGS